MIEILYHIIMISPAAVEVFEDRKGDEHTNYSDIVVRTVLMLFCATIVCIIKAFNVDSTFHRDIFIEWLPKTLIMSLMYFSGLFQYAVNISQRNVTEANWYNHLNKKSFPDKWSWYNSMNWRLRMIGHGLLIVIGWGYYFLLK